MSEVISSTANQKVVAASALKNAAKRRDTGLFLAEGEKLIREALSSDIEVRSVFADRKSEASLALTRDDAFKNLEIYLTEAAVIKKISDAVTPQSMVAVCAIPRRRTQLRGAGRYILLEDIRDPGNLGNIARSAESFCFDAIIAVGGVADPFGPKSVRASAGSLFRIPVLSYADAGSAVSDLRAAGICVAAADLRRDSLSTDALPGEGICIAIGNEGAGISEQLRTLADMSIEIKTGGAAESLSAQTAAAVLMWEVYKKGVLS